MQRITNTKESQFGSTEKRLHELLAQGLAGDAVAYRVFLGELSSHLRAFLRKRLAYMQDDVDDVVQETLLAVHNQRHTYDVSQPLTAWVHAIAKYKLVDFFRRRAGRDQLTDSIDDFDLFAASDDQASEARRDILKLLDQLPDRQRLPIFHTKLEGLSIAETAQITGMSESAVKVGVHRGLKTLAAKMRDET